MNGNRDFAVAIPQETVDWRRNRKLVKEGLKDLEYVPRGRTEWNTTLSALAFSARRQLGDRCDLNLWAAMHGCPASRRYADLEDSALVLWHGTSAARARKIREHGLFSKRGLWTTMEPAIAHGYARSRSRNPGAGSATVVLVLDRRAFKLEQHYYRQNPDIYVFRAGLGPEWVEYILWDGHLEFAGDERANAPKPWGRARFTKRDGRWTPRSRPPVRLDGAHEYSTRDEWLEVSVRRILETLGQAAAIEIFSSLYATIDPWDALDHADVLAALDRLCRTSRRRIRAYTLGEPTR
jgi:hypothetical protein